MTPIQKIQAAATQCRINAASSINFTGKDDLNRRLASAERLWEPLADMLEYSVNNSIGHRNNLLLAITQAILGDTND